MSEDAKPHSDRTPDERPRWLDQPRNIDRIYYGLIALCVISVGADFFYAKHVHYAAEDIVGAYGIYSFVSCVVLVLAAKALRKLLKRDEEFYDADD